MILEGQSLVFKGRLRQLKKKQIEALCQHTGALFKSSISYGTNLLILGITKNDKELQKAQEHNTEIMTEAEFIEHFHLLATTEERWQILRGLLFQPMNHETEAKICQHLSLWPETDDLEMAIDYVYEHVGSDPRAQLSAPKQWVRELIAGQDQPRLRAAPRARFQPDYQGTKIQPEIAKGIASCPSFGALTEMSFRQSGLTDKALKQLCHSPYLSPSIALDLRNNPLSERCLSIIADSPMASSLRALSIGSLSEIGQRELDLSLLADGHFPQLKKLSIASCHASDEGVEALAASNLPLEELHFRFAGLTDKSIHALAASSSLALQALGLCAIHPSEEAFMALMKAPWLPQLLSLDLGINSLTDDHIKHLADAPLPHLRELNLQLNKITEEGCRELYLREDGPTPEILDLYGNKIHDEGINHIVSSPRSAMLRQLNIKSTEFTEVGIKAIAESPQMTQLTRLHLTDYTIDPEWALDLYHSPYLPESLRIVWSWALPETDESKQEQRLLSLSFGNQYDELKACIAEGADPSHLKEWTGSSAEEMCKEGRQHCLTLLFDAGMSVNIQDTSGHSFLLAGMLTQSAEFGKERWAADLLRRGADVNLANDKGLTPLHAAAFYGELGCVELLLEAGASVDALGVGGVFVAYEYVHISGTPLHAAACSHHEQSPRLLERLLNAGADPNTLNLDGQTPLQMTWRQPEDWGKRSRWLEYKGHWPTVQAFIDLLGKDCIETPDHRGMTPLFFAIRSRQLEQVEALVGLGAKLDVQVQRTKKSPLHEAIESNHLECIPVLLQAGANPNLPNNKGETPLYLAVEYIQREETELLLEAGADPNIDTKAGISPLMLALTLALRHENVEKSLRQIIELLLKHKASLDTSVKTETRLYGYELKKGDTPRQLLSGLPFGAALLE